MVLTVIMFIVGAGLGAVAMFGYTKYLAKTVLQDAEIRARRIVGEAQLEAENRKKEGELKAKEELLKIRKELEEESRSRLTEIKALEQRLLQREERIDERQKRIDEKEKEVDANKETVEMLKKKLNSLYEQQMIELQKVARLSKEEAAKKYMENLELELRTEASNKIKEIESQTTIVAEKKAKEIVALAIKRCAVDHTVETTTSAVTLPSDEMKGRIIGREGRNIRTFEALTGIDLIIDDTPDTVILSGFDPIRREIAKIALSSLVTDGRIHPSRVEEMIEKARKEVQARIRETGENLVNELGISNIHPKLIELLGRLKYRTSYGQNTLQHSLEVAELSSLMAQELGVNHKLAKRAGLLHDIGKAIDFEHEGTHAQLGAEVAKKFGEQDDVVHAIAAHHEDMELRTIEAIIVLVADAISASRPGARKESLESYVKRLEKLEAIANSFPGVERSFAVQAGREIRVMVKPEEIDDSGAAKLARDIAKKIENELEYPGQIRVSLIREMRVQELAK